jgi:hypothetical protein
VNADGGAQGGGWEQERPHELDRVRVVGVAEPEEQAEPEQEDDRPGGPQNARRARPVRAVGAREHPADVGLLDASGVEGRTQLGKEVVVLHLRYI